MTLLGRVPRERMPHFYEMAHLVVLTSKSEGIPLVLMEAMAHRRIVLAPADHRNSGTGDRRQDRVSLRTGGPGRLCATGSREICQSTASLDAVGQSARQHVLRLFHQQTNLTSFADFFLDQIAGTQPRFKHADLVLQ